jgi:putative acyl-CoA dehydrogenase
MPRFRPDGSVNGLRFQRLKDKLGNRSNASSEVEFTEAYGLRVGEEGRGVRTILQMVQLTRLDCAISSAGLMRMALAQAIHHARHRSVFQKRLADQPAMRAVLADMALEAEAMIALVMRLCRAFDGAAADADEAAYARVMTPAVKYWVCKSAPGFIYEAMECLGGNGYVEESILPRLYREAPVNAIWEGAGNVMCLDVLRVVERDADLAHNGLDRIATDAGMREPVDDIVAMLKSPLAESRARSAVERLVLVAALAALRHCSPSTVAELFMRNRLRVPRGYMWGTADISDSDSVALMERAVPR